jgi:hypothetical protein
MGRNPRATDGLIDRYYESDCAFTDPMLRIKPASNSRDTLKLIWAVYRVGARSQGRTCSDLTLPSSNAGNRLRAFGSGSASTVFTTAGTMCSSTWSTPRSSSCACDYPTSASCPFLTSNTARQTDYGESDTIGTVIRWTAPASGGSGVYGSTCCMTCT